MGSRIRSYCTAGDPFCDVGNPVNANAEAHLTYVEDYGEEVVAYVVEQYRNGGLSNGTDGRDGPAGSSDAAATGQESAGSGRVGMSWAAAAVPFVAFWMVVS